MRRWREPPPAWPDKDDLDGLLEEKAASYVTPGGSRLLEFCLSIQTNCKTNEFMGKDFKKKIPDIQFNLCLFFFLKKKTHSSLTERLYAG